MIIFFRCYKEAHQSFNEYVRGFGGCGEAYGNGSDCRLPENHALDLNGSTITSKDCSESRICILESKFNFPKEHPPKLENDCPKYPTPTVVHLIST
jgi:hypothetical protein